MYHDDPAVPPVGVCPAEFQAQAQRVCEQRCSCCTVGKVKNWSIFTTESQDSGGGNDRPPKQQGILQPIKIVTEICVLINIQKKSNSVSNKLSKVQNCFLELHHTSKKCLTSTGQRAA